MEESLQKKRSVAFKQGPCQSAYESGLVQEAGSRVERGGKRGFAGRFCFLQGTGRGTIYRLWCCDRAIGRMPCACFRGCVKERPGRCTGFFYARENSGPSGRGEAASESAEDEHDDPARVTAERGHGCLRVDCIPGLSIHVSAEPGHGFHARNGMDLVLFSTGLSGVNPGIAEESQTCRW